MLRRFRSLGLRTAAAALAAAALLPLLPSPVAGVERDPQAVEIARRTMEAMGGRAAFDAVRVLRFTFVVERDGKELARRSHVWDRWDGRHRLETVTSEGKPLLVLMNDTDGTGNAWVDGKKLDAEAAAPYLELGHGSLINDSYWLLMPWKWLDPGVELAYRGEKTVDGTVYDVVHLAFASGTGLTSGDQYWGYVSRESGLMERWDYLLQDKDGNPGTGSRSTFLWQDWSPVEGSAIRLARDKVRTGDGPPVAIRFPEVTASAEPDTAVFRPPGP